ncbi:hypothetical protein TNCV_4706631 [Trichonephila clavipes]|nr:hypothetical protein TNCV_4706631 [Trichonephila clavipes]
MKKGLIALNYECSKCNERMGLYERKSAVLDGDFEWVCSTITSQNIYGRTPMILLTMRPSRLFVKIRCHAVASTRKKISRILRTSLDTENIRLFPWPARSPDFSPIENVWTMVAERLAHHHTLITTVGKHPIHSSRSNSFSLFAEMRVSCRNVRRVERLMFVNSSKAKSSYVMCESSESEALNQMTLPS